MQQQTQRRIALRFRPGKPRFEKLGSAAVSQPQQSKTVTSKTTRPADLKLRPAVGAVVAAAAVKIKKKLRSKSVDPGHQLLSDMLRIFAAKQVLVIKTRDLLAELSSLDIYSKLNAKSLAAKLRPFKICPCGHWFPELGSDKKRSAKSYKLLAVRKAYRRLKK